MMAQDKTESWLTYAGQVAHWSADYSHIFQFRKLNVPAAFRHAFSPLIDGLIIPQKRRKS